MAYSRYVIRFYSNYTKFMSMIVKLVTAIIIIIALVWGWKEYAPSSQNTTPVERSEQVVNTDKAGQDAAAAVSASGSSDTSLDADLNTIDTQLQAASQSSASVDSGLNDKSGDVAY